MRLSEYYDELQPSSFWDGGGGSHLLVIVSRGTHQTSGHAMLTDDSESSCSQLQPVCELLIPRRELVIVLGINTGPSAGCLRGQGADGEAS